MIAARLLLLLFLLVTLPVAGTAGLARHRDLVVADRAGKALAVGEVRITYLGTNGYLLEAREGAILIDPYLSRIGLWATARNAVVASDPERLHRLLPQLRDLKRILVTHGHIDHLLDSVAIARLTRVPLIASSSSVHLAQAAGVTAVQAVRPGNRLDLGKIRIEIFAASHDRILGLIPFPGSLRLGGKPPRRVSAWVCGEPLAFLIELGGKRIYIDSGGTGAVRPPRGAVDLAILGVALPDSRRRLPEALKRLHPRYFLPSHQDDFFQPIERGFRFGLLTDFPAIRHDHAQNGWPGRLILLDYFRPWTLR